MPAALIWLIAALALAGAEALTGDMFLLMLGGGALAAAGTSLAVRRPVGDGVVFAVVSVLLLVLVRPALRRHFCPAGPAGAGIEGAGGQERAGARPGGRHEGQVKLDGEVWTARPLNETMSTNRATR